MFHANGQTYMTKTLVAFRNSSGKGEKKVARLVKLNTFGVGGPPPVITRRNSAKIYCRHSLVTERAEPCAGYVAAVPSGITDQLASLHSSALQCGGRVIHGS
jgi:hypothetical protein